MLAQRVLVAVVLLPIGLAAIVIGGWVFVVVAGIILSLAAWEYVQLYRTSELEPAGYLVVPGILLILFGRAWNGFESGDWIISLLILMSMGYHLVAYERGRDRAATDFAVTLSAMFYIGWLGAYLISLRNLPEGMWWVLLVLPAVWIADSGAYFVGRAIGRHNLSPRLSPKKTWEGYLGGIVVGTIGTALLAAIFGALAGPDSVITVWRGAVLGFVLGVVPTLGDLGESMIKRQVGAKDSGTLLPGHGGVFDRIDSWVWAGVIGYYLIIWLWI
jgi:phosphatidate cytidylyltransferase